MFVKVFETPMELSKFIIFVTFCYYFVISNSLFLLNLYMNGVVREVQTRTLERGSQLVVMVSCYLQMTQCWW